MKTMPDSSRGRSYCSYASFRDADSDSRLLPEITQWLPGRV